MPLAPDAVHRLADLVPYAEGTVASRSLLKNRGGSVTLFAFDAGEGLSEHTTPHDALLLVTDGTAHVTLRDTTRHLAAGDAVLLPADVPHAVHAPTAFQMLLVMLRA